MTNIRQLSQAQSAVSLVPQQRSSALEDRKRSKESFTASYRSSSTATALEFITLVGLLASGWIVRLIGSRVESAVTRLLGVLLAALAAQYVIDGVRGSFGI